MDDIEKVEACEFMVEKLLMDSVGEGGRCTFGAEVFCPSVVVGELDECVGRVLRYLLSGLSGVLC